MEHRIRPTLLLALESGGAATALARIGDPRILKTAIASAIREKRRAARAAGVGRLSQRSLLEIAELQEALR